jgi:preprotein translocase subunit SecA
VEREAGALSREALVHSIKADALAAYDAREAEVGPEVMRELERRVLLSVLDRKWREHLYEMDYLREGIYLRAYSQRDPLVEYQREGFDMFATMMDGIAEESVGFLFNLEVQVEEEEPTAPEVELEVIPDTAVADVPAAPESLMKPREVPHIVAKGLHKPSAPQNLSYSAPSEDGEVAVSGTTVTNTDDPYATAGRNAACPCGSGKKYKKCHGAPGGPTGLTTRVNG